MGRRLPHTPSSIIRNALRRLWLRSRERAAAVKRDSNTCQKCGRKGSVAKGRECKIHVHHARRRPGWEEVEMAIRYHVLQTPDDLVCLCEDCHRCQHFTTK
jgi:5-methylcytosine-specific restriction endonuclease McrA